ncbi:MULTISPECIES: Gfo/Idh/MocA family protein [unclassified Shinella]|uniref:Gfo/Idh/MocA family protein n=1 Tax=unclassified Shinella TaxID=2643062 RepID=UPI00225CB308|nr:Gfo/Idh/MocA family oxidoreductase [Shinella sp. YE25]MDC7260128.1 Gfo/Idh/MocA family oxidoreductase [Shinella sp. YE25]CAI0341131.1 Gfo/Idh/MocA family oxidoreductase [Rhizobiaceae bacterium]CAK7262166.1 Gfo/Idh/MocA family oxidoreductase [Shinella sp. WSC3-e]
MFRWGVLSTATIARQQILPAIAESENGVVSAIASRNLAKAQTLARRFNASNAFGSYEELLASPDVDGVYIPLPTSMHVDWTKRAVEAGKHVLVEKPLANDAAEVESLLVLCQGRSLLVSEAFMIVYHPQWQKLREIVVSDRLGALRQVQGAFTYHNVDPGNVRNIQVLGGGGMADIGVYPILATRFATNTEPKRVRATIRRDAVFGTDVHASVAMDFGAFDLSFYVSTQMALRQYMLFHFEKGCVELEAPFNARQYAHAVVRISDQDHRSGEIFSFGEVNQYRLEVEAFVRAASAGGEAFSLESSLRNQQAVDAVLKAEHQDGWVSVRR